MNQFYKELKSLRKEKNIKLEDINERTKINLSSLKAIESGKFDQISHTYLRLFLRAYATEIGFDPEKALNDLNSYLNPEIQIKEAPSKENIINNKTKKKLLDNQEKGVEKNILSAKIKAPKRFRGDILKSTIVVIVLLFSIYIIQTINNESGQIKSESYLSEYESEGSISNKTLKDDYIIISESTQKMNEEPPFSVTLATEEQIWYRFNTDSLNATERLLPQGDSFMHEFVESIEILFNHTNGLNFYLNKKDINSFNNGFNPVKVFLSYKEKKISVQRFARKN